MAASKQRYPLSTISGQYIPLEVLRPSSVIRKDFLSASATTAEALPAGAELLMVRTTTDCFIKFANSSATKPTSASPSAPVVDTVYIQRGEVQAISPLALFYSVIGDTADGTVTIQVLETWQSISLDIQTRSK